MRPLITCPVLAIMFVLVRPAVVVAGGAIEAWGQKVILPPSQMAGFVKVANSGDFNVALRGDGTLCAWGHNVHGECAVPTSAEPFIDVAAGYHHGLAVTASGSLVGWGRNTYGQATPPSPNTGFVAVAAGAEFSLGLKADGTIVGWGFSWSSAEFPPTPNSGWVQIAANAETCVARRADGSVRAWGEIQPNVPAPNSGFVDVAAGYGFVVLLRDDGSLVHFGYNHDGLNILPDPNSGFAAVAAGDQHALGVRDDGSIVAWGSNDYGQCDVPVPNIGFVAAAAGYFHSVGLRSDGPVSGWGMDDEGQAGGPLVADAVEVSWADRVGVARHVDGSLTVWGLDVSPPVPNEGFVQVATVPYSALALRDDGTVVRLGTRYWDGSGFTPAMFSPNENIVAIDAGLSHAIALRDDGSVLVMATDLSLKTVPEPNTGFTAVAAGGTLNLGLKEDGSIVAWGQNAYGQLAVPEPNQDFVGIAAGHGFGLGLRSDGTCVAWGVQLATPTVGNHDLVEIEAWGPYLAAGRRADGSLEIWGDVSGHASAFEVPEPNSGFIDVSAGYHGIVALRSSAATAVGPELPMASPLTLAASPNPFNPSVSLTVTSRESVFVSLEVLDLAGRRLAVLWRGELAAGGSHTAQWNGRSDQGRELPSGTYLLRARSPRATMVSHKITLVR